MKQDADALTDAKEAELADLTAQRGGYGVQYDNNPRYQELMDRVIAEHKAKYPYGNSPKEVQKRRVKSRPAIRECHVADLFVAEEDE